MKIKNHTELSKYFTVGDEIWACAFEYEAHKVGFDPKKALYQTPIKGVLVTHKNGAKDKNKLKNGGNTKINYFVPLKADGIEPMYSKLVNLESRCYATTYEECVELYNELIDNCIEWHNQQIAELIGQKQFT